MLWVRKLSQLFSLSCLQNKYTQKCLTDCTNHRSSASFPRNLCFQLHIFYSFVRVFFFLLIWPPRTMPLMLLIHILQGGHFAWKTSTQNYGNRNLAQEQEFTALCWFCIINVQKFPPQKHNPPIYTLLFLSSPIWNNLLRANRFIFLQPLYYTIQFSGTVHPW